jgi:hypothetical protein
MFIVIYFDCESFKDKFINAIEDFINDYNDNDTIIAGDGYEIFEIEDLYALRDASIIDKDERGIIKDVEGKVIISESCFCHIYIGGFKSNYGYMNDDNTGAWVKNSDFLKYKTIVSDAELINNMEFFHKKIYIQRIDIEYLSIDAASNEDTLYVTDFIIPNSSEHIRLSDKANFLFSMKLLNNKCESPVCHDNFIIITGENLNIDDCRVACNSLIFESGSLYDVIIKASPNNSDTHEVDIVINNEYLNLNSTSLIICKDTDEVIKLYNKAISTGDSEFAILYFSKIIEFISQTVVRAKITELGRKALSSKRAMNPDASFIKELQYLFKDNSYQKDSDSIKITVQTCSYVNDIISVIPKYMENKFKTDLKKGEDHALAYVASCITATRNNIAHAKSNYKASNLEASEEHYDEFAKLLKIISEHCIRWFSVQNPFSRVL